MSIAFCCPHCGRKISASEAHVGKSCFCPTCKGKLAVPKILNKPAVTVARVDTPAAPPCSTKLQGIKRKALITAVTLASLAGLWLLISTCFLQKDLFRAVPAQCVNITYFNVEGIMALEGISPHERELRQTGISLIEKSYSKQSGFWKALGVATVAAQEICDGVYADRRELLRIYRVAAQDGDRIHDLLKGDMGLKPFTECGVAIYWTPQTGEHIIRLSQTLYAYSTSRITAQQICQTAAGNQPDARAKGGALYRCQTAGMLMLTCSRGASEWNGQLGKYAFPVESQYVFGGARPEVRLSYTSYDGEGARVALSEKSAEQKRKAGEELLRNIGSDPAQWKVDTADGAFTFQCSVDKVRITMLMNVQGGWKTQSFLSTSRMDGNAIR